MITAVSVELVKRELRKPDKDYRYEEIVSSPQIKTQRQIRNLNRYEQAERQIIQLLLEDGINILKFDNLGVYLYSKVCRDIAAIIVEKYYDTNRKVELADLYNDLDDEMRKLISEIEMEKYPPADIQDLSKIVMQDYQEEQHEEILERKILESKDAKTQAELALELINARKSKQRIKEEKD